MRISTATLLAVAAFALAPAAAQAQSTPTKIAKAWIPIQRTAAQRRHRGPATMRVRLIATPGEYKSFFDPQGAWAIDRQPFYSGGERVVAFAPGEGRGTPTIMSVRQDGATLQLRVAYQDQVENAAERSRPFHAVVIRAEALKGPVTSFAILPFFLEPSNPGTGGSKPKPTPKSAPKPRIDRALGGTPVSTDAPLGRKSLPILRTVARWRADQRGEGLGPDTRKAGFATTPGEYKALFYPQGQWAVRKPVFYTGGERVVFVSAGQEGVELKIVRLIQRGPIVTAVVQQRALRPGTLGRAFHAVAIRSRDLTCPVARVVAVMDRTATDREIPIRGEVAKPTRYGGPSRKRAGLAATPGQYKALFSPQGQWSVDAQPYYTNGERAVVIAGGEGNFDLKITALHQRGSTLFATVETRPLPPSVLARPFHAVKILASDLEGKIRRVRVRVKETAATTPATAADTRGLSGALKD